MAIIPDMMIMISSESSKRGIIQNNIASEHRRGRELLYHEERGIDSDPDSSQIANRGVDFYFEFLPAKARRRFLF